MRIKSFKKFNESRSSYDKVFNISDIIDMLENKPSKNIIFQFDYKIKGENVYIVNDIIELPSEGMKMSSKTHYVEFDGDEYDFYTIKPSDYLMERGYIDDVVKSDEVKLPEHKTIGDLLVVLKNIPNPDKSLFFIPSFPMGYDKGSYGDYFANVLGLADFNLDTFPLTKNGEMVTGNLTSDDANIFMSLGIDSGGEYTYIKK
jgi:hypothetical protein